MSSHKTLLIPRRQTERVKHQYWGSSWNSFCSAWCACHPRATTYAGSATKALQPFRKNMVWGKWGGQFEWGVYALPGWSGPCSPIRKKWGLEESFLFSSLDHCLWVSEIMSWSYGGSKVFKDHMASKGEESKCPIHHLESPFWVVLGESADQE